MQIEPARQSDVPALCALLSSLFEQEVEFAPDPEAQRRGLEAILADHDVGLILVARRDGRVIGMANLLFTVSTALGARVAILDDLVVDAAARGAGVGSALLERAIATAREQGCRRISLHTDASNVSAQRLYRRFGFADSSMLSLKLSLASSSDVAQPDRRRFV